MKKVLTLVLTICLLSALFVGSAFAAGEDQDIVILFTSDIHCGVDQGWGYAGLYAVKQNLSNSYNVLLVDDGDAIQGEAIGTMTKGEAIVEIMNTVGYDVAIPGNHEFDYGMPRFLELVKEKAKYPYISCNFNKGGELVLDPWIMKEAGGIKIAFVGATTPDTLRSSTPKYFKDENDQFIYGFMQDETGEKLYSAIQKAVDEARAAGADYVVLMGHLGNEEECIPWRYNDVISHCSGIDILLDGHSHDTDIVTMKDKDGKDVVRAACGTKLAEIGVVHITRDGKISAEHYHWVSSVSLPELLGIDNAAAEAVVKATADLKEKLAEVVAVSNVDLITHDPVAKTDDGKAVRVIRRAETNLGDLCADAYLDQSGEADIAFMNGGGIRVPLNKGNITLGDILKVHPYGNSLTVIEVTGQQVLDALEWSVHALPGEFGGFNHVAGMTFEYDSTIESPCVTDETNVMFDHIDETKERRVRNVLIKGVPLDPKATYKLAAIDYQLLDEGDGYTMYKGARIVQDRVKLDNQVLIDYITDTLGGVIADGYTEPYGQGRIVSVNPEQ